MSIPHRPDPQRAGFEALVEAGLVGPDSDPIWCVQRASDPDRADGVFWEAYRAAHRGCVSARDIDGKDRWIPAVYVGQSRRPGFLPDCSVTRAGVYRLDTGRLVWAYAHCNGDDDIRERTHITVREEDVIEAPLPSPEDEAAGYAETMRDRMWTIAQAHGAGVVVG